MKQNIKYSLKITRLDVMLLSIFLLINSQLILAQSYYNFGISNPQFEFNKHKSIDPFRKIQGDYNIQYYTLHPSLQLKKKKNGFYVNYIIGINILHKKENNNIINTKYDTLWKYQSVSISIIDAQIQMGIGKIFQMGNCFITTSINGVTGITLKSKTNIYDSSTNNNTFIIIGTNQIRFSKYLALGLSSIIDFNYMISPKAYLTIGIQAQSLMNIALVPVKSYSLETNNKVITYESHTINDRERVIKSDFSYYPIFGFGITVD